MAQLALIRLHWVCVVRNVTGSRQGLSGTFKSTIYFVLIKQLAEHGRARLVWESGPVVNQKIGLLRHS